MSAKSPPALPPSLFQFGTFKLHGGGETNFLLDCQALTPTDWQTLAAVAVRLLLPFQQVVGVPRGGLPFAEALLPFCRKTASHVLLVDDVLTTGTSLERLRRETFGDPIGCVVFARGPCPAWVKPLFTAYWALPPAFGYRRP